MKMAKKGKMKISKVKRNNQTTNKMKKQGKLKLQRHRQKVQKHKQPTQTQPEYSSESESSSNEWADMLDEGEQQYIVNRLAKQPQLLSNVPEKDPELKNSSKRKRGKEKIPKPKPANLEMNSESNSDSETNSDVEEKYEMEMAERPKKKLRPLLPIKTKDGVLERTEECEDSESEQEKEEAMEAPNDIDDMESADSGVEDPEEPEPLEKDEVTTVELLAARRDRLRNDKLRIGALCSSLLESPEKKIKNLFPILYLMEEKLKDGTVNLISVRKLATLSAAEVFRDILPDYKIRHQDYSDIKLKKDTLALYKYEKELLEFYKRYLQRLEKAANVLRRKKGDNRKPDESSISLALLSINCMCSVFTARPNFNYATNIAQSLIPLLGSSNQQARESVTQCCEEVFKEDNKGEITLAIVRLINQLVKRRGDRLHPSALDCLLSLKIRDVELDKEAEIQHKKKQDEKHKKRIVNLSKKEKKRAKKLKEVERELLETQAQESESARLKQLTEVTKTVFHIYFRLLKTAPRSGLLAAALNGLAKFTHVINLEYYSDLVGILSALLRDEAIGHRERLLCVRTVLSILSGAGDALNVDPAHFHSHLYTSALTVHAGASHADAKIIIEAAWQICSRARRVSPAVLRAFAKRLLTMAMQVQHNAALASLAVIHGLMQQNKTISSLFETDETVGSGRFDPTLPSPEHCNAHSATGYEACLLRRHYHPTARDAARAVLTQAGWPQELHKLTPNQIFNQYDGSQMAFKPSIPPPKAKEGKSKMSTNWAVQDFKEYCSGVEEAVTMEIHIK